MIGVPLDHIASHVGDREGAAKVVRELLGHEHVQDLDVPSAEGAARLAVFAQRGNRFRLVLCDAEREHPIARWIRTRGPGVHHIAHRVGAIEPSLEQVVESGGAPVGGIADAPGLRQAFTEITRDGILHELTQRIDSADFVEGNTKALIDAGADRNAVTPPAAPWSEHRR